MKTEKNILVAFILNISFSIFEIVGGIMTNSVAIISDAIHDMGDAISIGISYFLEKKSKNKPDKKYTYGYARYSVLGAFITTTILTVGSILMIIASISRLFKPQEVHYEGMIIIALIGFIVNILAAYVTKEGDSLNQKSVNLHMLEDVFGWFIVLVGSILMKIFDITLLDSIMSLIVSSFILFNTFKNLKSILDLFLEKIPNNIDIDELKTHILKIDGVTDIHHIHVWSLDGEKNYATLHAVVKNENLKEKIREELEEFEITHSTIETESKKCNNEECKIEFKKTFHGHHH